MRKRGYSLKLCPSCHAFQDAEKKQCPNCNNDLTNVLLYKSNNSNIIPDIPDLYYCNKCKHYTPKGLMKGSGWIELILYLCYLVPGIIYSIWRRSGQPNVCPFCKTEGLIPILSPQPASQAGTLVTEIRVEVECPHCAEIILAKAKICKHCGKEI